MKKFLCLLLFCCLLVGCSSQSSQEEKVDSNPIPSDTTNKTNLSEDDMFTNRDLDESFDKDQCIQIQLDVNGSSASSDSVQIKDNVITISEEATYYISGQLDDGSLVVNANDQAKIHFIFDNVSLTSKTSAPLYIVEADKVVITLAKDSKNILSSGDSFIAIDDNNIDGTIFSKQDLSFNGSGSLEIISPSGHGIVCKDDLVISNGSYVIQSASHGLDVNDSIRIGGSDTKIDIVAGKDGMHCENSDDTSLGFIYIVDISTTLKVEGDGMDAGSDVTIKGGHLNIVAGGGSENGTKQSSDQFGGFMGGGRPGEFHSNATTTDEDSTSMKGIKATNHLLIDGGIFEINAADDSLHSNGNVTINGGEFIIATGDDALHSEDTLLVNGGKIDVSESYEGLEALHIDVKGGDISLVASDDGFNAAGGVDESGFTGGRDGMFGGPGGHGGFGGGMSSNSDGTITISGGNIHIEAYGDGIDANGSVTISGGNTIVVGPTYGDTATLDYDISCSISGGSFIGTGGAGMAQSFSEANQGLLALNVGNVSANTPIIILDQDGKEVVSHTPTLDYAVVIISTPDIISQNTYTVNIGEQSADIQAN